MAVAKYGGPVGYYNQSIIDASARHWFKSFLPLTKNKSRKIFNFYEAVRGEPGVRFCEAIPRKTSPGFPL